MKMRGKTLIALTLLCVFLVTLIPLSVGAAVTVDKIYYDIDFEDAAISSDAWPNKASSGLTFSWQQWASNVAYSDSTQTVVNDSATGSKVMKLSIPKGTTGVYYTGAPARGTAQSVVTTDSFDNKVTWYKLSFRYEGAVTQFNFVAVAHTLFEIAADGTVHVGHGKAAPVINFTPEVGKWYDLTIAVDNINKYKISDTRYDTRIYAWINGELLLTGTENAGKCTIARPSSETTSAGQFLFGTPRSETTDVNMYFDNLKWYTSTESVDASGFYPVIPNGKLLPKVLYNLDFDSFSTFDTPMGLRKATRNVMGGSYPEEDLDDVTSVVVNAPGDHYYCLKGKDGKQFFFDFFVHGVGSKDFSGDTILQADYRVGANNTQSVSVGMRADTPSTGQNLFIVDKDGYFYYKDANSNYAKASNISCKNNWVNFAIATHFDERTYDIYVNGAKVKSGLPINEDLSTSMFYIRYEYMGTTTNADAFDMDNLWLYKSDKYYDHRTLTGPDGEYLRELEPWTHEIDKSAISPNYNIFEEITVAPTINPTVRLTDYAEAKEAYKDAVAFAGGTNNIWIKDGKYSSDYETAYEGEHLLVAAPVLAAICNKPLSVSGDTATIGNVTATVGSTYIGVGSKSITTNVKVQKIDGTIYIPLEEFAIYGMKKWYGASSLGFGVIANEERDVHFEVDANRPNLHTVGNTSHMMAYLIMDLPNATALTTKIASAKPATRPFIAGTPEYFAELKQIAETDEMARKLSLATISNADKICATTYTGSSEPNVEPSPMLSGSEPWTLYWAYYMTGDDKYVEKAEELALIISSFSHWASEFHFLRTASLMEAAAYFYDLFYYEFDQSTLDALANAVIEKGLKPANKYFEGYTHETHNDWCTRCTNWNIIPNSGIMIAASTFLGEGYDDVTISKTFERAFVSLGYGMTYFSPDGGGAEGMGYAAFTLGYICAAIDALERAYGTDFGICDYPGFLNAGGYLPNAMGSKYHFGFNTEAAESSSAPEIGLWFARRNDDPVLADAILNFYDRNPQNLKAYAMNLLRYYKVCERLDEPQLPLDSIFAEAGLAFSRDNHGPSSTYMGMHGGYNHISHGRYDFGTFRFDAFGERFASSIGTDSMPSLGNFTGNSHYYVIRAEGHNVYVVNPDEDPGQNRYTYGYPKMVEQKDKGTIFTLDMTPAYSADVKSATRGFMLTNDRKVMVIQDEIVPYNNDKDDFYWFWNTFADIEINNSDNTVILTRNHKKVKLYFDATVDITLEEMAIEPLPTSPNPEGQLSTDYNDRIDEARKIAARFKGNGQPITFRVIAEPVGQSYPRTALTPISDWSIPDGSTDDDYYSKATTIKANGLEIAKFNPDTLDYTMYYDGSMPTITAESAGNITITQATTSGDTAIVKIQDKQYTNNYKIYTITLLSRDEALGKVTKLIDCDFTDHKDLTFTKDTENFFLYYSRGSTYFVTDPQRDSRVLHVKMPSADVSNNGNLSTAMTHIDRRYTLQDTETEPGGIYFEFSFKADSYSAFTAQIGDQPMFDITRDGKMRVLYSVGKGAFDIGTYNPGEWYNIKIVRDTKYKYWGLHSRTFVYVNGNKYATISDPFQSEEWEATFLGSTPKLTSTEIRFTFCANQSDLVNFYLDDVVLYHTENGPYGVVDVDSDLIGTNVLSDSFSINSKGKEVYVPEFVTVKRLLDSIDPYTDSLITISKNGATVTDENKASTTALSGKLFVRGTTGKLIVPYDITTGTPGFDATWTLKKGDNKATVGSLSEIAAGDKIYLTSNVTNNTGVDKSATLVFAAYDGDTLIGVKTQPFTVKASKTAIVNTLEAITLPATLTNLSVKAFIWENLTDAKPIMNDHAFN